jgi:hypothetical protein
LSKGFLCPDITKDKFPEACKALVEYSKADKISPETIAQMCEAFVARSSPGDLTDTILYYYNEIIGFQMEIDPKTPDIPPQLYPMISPDSWAGAWETEYEARALKNFLLYLDTLWQQRRTNWEYGKGTSCSFCATIMQSSCAGKSRLVYS